MNLLLHATIDMLLTRSIGAVVPVAVFSLLLLAVTFFSAFLFVLMSGAACQLVAYWLDQRPVTLLRAYGTALRFFWKLAGAMMAVFAIVVGGLVAAGVFLAVFYIGFLVIFNIDLARDPRFLWFLLGILGVLGIIGCFVLLDALVRWSVFVQVIIIEGRGPLESLERSARLVRGNWWRTAGALALLSLVPLLLMLVLGSVLNIALFPLVRAGVASTEVVNGVAIAIAQVVFSPIPAIGVTLLFYRLRDGPAIWERIESTSS